MPERPYRRRPFRIASQASPRCLDREEGHRARHRHDHRPRPAQGALRLVHNHLYGIEDFWIAFARSRDYATAERLALEFAEDFRLLADIGWAAKDERETFELTMPAHDLMELLQRLRSEAVPILVESGAEAESSREDAKTDGRFQLGYEACEKLLDELDPRETGRGRSERTPRPAAHLVLVG